MKKQKLLQEIEMLFFDNSFAELSMNDVSLHLGMKKASLYYHFPSKETMFVETLVFSYERYTTFLEGIFQEKDLTTMLKKLITYPYSEKNLYSIVLQRGYCKTDFIREFIRERIFLDQALFAAGISVPYAITQEKLILLKCVIDDLAKKYCILGCSSNVDVEKIIHDIIILFFKS